MSLHTRRDLVSRRLFLRSAAAVAGTAGVAVVLQACGPAAQPTTAPPPPAPTATPAPAAAAPTAKPAVAAPTAAPVPAAAPKTAGKGPTTLEVWIWETVEHWEKVVKASGIEEALPEVKLKYVALPGAQLQQKFTVGLAAGMPAGMPDICRTSLNYYQEMVNSGGLAETTEQVKPGQKDIVPASYEAVLVKGKLYAVPDDMIATQLGYRIDLFEKAGLPTDPSEVSKLVPTWEDFVKVAAPAAKKLGVNLMNFGPDAGFFLDQSTQVSTGFFDKDGNPIFDSPDHVKAMENVKRIWDTGLISSLAGPQFWGAHKEGKILTVAWPQYWDFVILDNAPEAKGKWRVAKLPAVQAGGKRITGNHCCNLVFAKFVPPEKLELAKKAAAYLRLTIKGNVAHMESFPGAFVSHIPSLEAMRPRPSPVLDGQKTYDLYLNALAEEKMNPRYMTSVFNTRANTEIVKNAAFSILKENAPVAATLKKAADDLRDLQKREGKI